MQPVDLLKLAIAEIGMACATSIINEIDQKPIFLSYE